MIRKLAALMAATALALLTPAAPAAADTPWWTPPATPSLPLHWVLDTGAGDPRINPDNPWHAGRCPLGATTTAQCTLPPAAVLDYDGDYNTRVGDGTHRQFGINATLHSRGVRTICYMDAGVQEASGSNASAVYDREPAYRFPVDRQSKASSWGGWWIDFTEPGTGTIGVDPRVLATVERRIQDWCGSALPLGDPERFDMVEFDEIDYWENSPSSPDVTYASQVVYARALFDLAHRYGFGALQKGDIIQTQDLVGYADATLNEECARYRECTNPWNPLTGQEQVGLQAYTAAGKHVWVAEYTSTAYNRLCSTYGAASAHWDGARYKLGLPASGGRQPCSGTF